MDELERRGRLLEEEVKKLRAERDRGAKESAEGDRQAVAKGPGHRTESQGVVKGKGVESVPVVRSTSTRDEGYRTFKQIESVRLPR